MGGYSISGGQVGYDRLLRLARERQSDTLAVLERAGVGEGMRCLDLGCGGGAVTFELARLVGPAGAVVGIDMDEVKLGLARESARAQAISNVEFRPADVTGWAEVDAYDVVYARFLLQHVPEPVDLLRRMWTAVRVGGRLVVEDADFDGCFSEPANDGFALFLAVYPELLARRGGDATIGRKLHRYFREVGIPEAGLRVVNSVHSAGELKRLRLSTLETTAEAMVADGLVEVGELTAALESLAAFTDDPATVIGGPQIFQAWAIRTR